MVPLATVGMRVDRGRNESDKVDQLKPKRVGSMREEGEDEEVEDAEEEDAVAISGDTADDGLFIDFVVDCVLYCCNLVNNSSDTCC